MSQGPLKNMSIIELGHVIAGPLADFGAEVIKVENPRGGDMMRDLGPKAQDDGLGGVENTGAQQTDFGS